jgi:hypothetical protein
MSEQTQTGKAIADMRLQESIDRANGVYARLKVPSRPPEVAALLTLAVLLDWNVTAIINNMPDQNP